MIKFQPLPSAPNEYSQSEESLFRRGVENSLISTYAELGGAITAQGGESSPASKRETLLLTKPGMSIRAGTDSAAGENTAIDTSNSAVVTVSGLDNIIIANSSPLVITNFVGGVPNRMLTVMSYQTIGLTITDGSEINLEGSSDLVFPMTTNSLYSNVSLLFSAGKWIEVSRSLL